MTKQTVLILDFGAQYSQLIARRVRDFQVYCEVVPHDISSNEIQAKRPVGIILSGGPSVVTCENAPTPDIDIFKLGIPILGICYGFQIIGHLFGGKVVASQVCEYGCTDIFFKTDNKLLSGLDEHNKCWMSHTYCVDVSPPGFDVIAWTDNCCCAAFCNENKKIYGIQFHAEVEHTLQGKEIIKNFLYSICNCKGDWIIENFAISTVEKLQKEIGNKKVLCALSGGVDSSVVAVILQKAIGDQLNCIFIDHGLLRKNERAEVEATFKKALGLNVTLVDAKDRFLGKLKGIAEPELKRKIIGEEFIRVFEAEGKKFGTIDILAQGTIYSDVIESGLKNSSIVKSHHNVGGLPKTFEFNEIIEPLRNLFKDEVRAVGRVLKIPSSVLDRQPFPGPGMAIRIIGEVTEEKLKILREADYIFRKELESASIIASQYFAVLTNILSVGVMGDERTYEYCLALRAVDTSDFMTSDCVEIPYTILKHTAAKIVNEVKKINRVVYDITSKPPSTIEWE